MSVMSLSFVYAIGNCMLFKFQVSKLILFMISCMVVNCLYCYASAHDLAVDGRVFAALFVMTTLGVGAEHHQLHG